MEQTSTEFGEVTKCFEVNVDDNDNQVFLRFFSQLSRAAADADVSTTTLLFMGMTGAGKSEIVEFIIICLTGQVQRPRNVRIQETKGTGDSQTKTVCRYEIRYNLGGFLVHTMLLLDTPGFCDVSGQEADNSHVRNICTAVGTISHINGVCYVVQSTLTRKSLDQIKSLCTVFSIMPQEALDCVSSIVTFSNSKFRCNDVMQVLGSLLSGIQDRPVIVIDNPWAEHANNTYRSVTMEDEDETDEEDDIQNNRELELKSVKIYDFILKFVVSNASFVPAGMAELQELKQEIFDQLAVIARLRTQIQDKLDMIAQLNISDVQKRLNEMSSEQWLSAMGYALRNGKPAKKLPGNKPFPGVSQALVCLNPSCLSVVCHEGCGIHISENRTSAEFNECMAMGDNPDSNTRNDDHPYCRVCPMRCSYKHHVLSATQIMWHEDETMISSFHDMQNSTVGTETQLENLRAELTPLQAQYANALNAFRKMAARLRQLAIKGDMHQILDIQRRLFESQRDMSRPDSDKRRSFQEIVTVIEGLMTALAEAQEENNSLLNSVREVLDRQTLFADRYNRVFC
ncbi:hypothetical protein BC830DRAFT_166035 [Chytriomyces sp. MP71]|nr:hypothetical protein BC830DRAFT_166035 [Chytriomyces sp. MP71]